ncbi:MAG: hypothetical protein AAGA48_17015, partial [Myxococcota bacterium]
QVCRLQPPMPAQVRSFEAVERVRDELARFGHRANDGLDELRGEIRRVIDWVEHDRPAYWKMRVAKAYDGVTEAKANLSRCLMYPINDETPSCAEERAALKKAQAYLVYCQEKQELVREWARKLRHELHEYEGRTARMQSLVEIDNPKAIALLERTLAALERYAGGSAAAGSALGSDSTARPAEAGPTPDPDPGADA